MHRTAQTGDSKALHRKSRGRMIGIVCFLLVILSLVAFYAVKREEAHKLQTWLEKVMTNEKTWILENQGSEGEIYMNGSKAGDVNPYFACIAALGLVTETKNCPITDKEQEAACNYLNWHTRMLLETDGKMGMFRKSGDSFVQTDKADSEDGYLGLYLWLMGEYLQRTQSEDGLENWQEGVSLALDRIKTLTKDGTTQVSEENATIYLLDNLEVWRGLYAMEASGFSETETIASMRKELESNIESKFWDKSNERWEVIRGSDEYDSDEFYPYGIAQVAPLIYEFPVKDTAKQKALYQQFTQNFKWQELNKERGGFAWTMTGMSAAQMEDVSSLREMIENYETLFSNNRKYPLYTGEAGWVCMECEHLYELYDDGFAMISRAVRNLMG